jgi:hypothetical protein
MSRFSSKSYTYVIGNPAKGQKQTNIQILDSPQSPILCGRHTTELVTMFNLVSIRFSSKSYTLKNKTVTLTNILRSNSPDSPQSPILSQSPILK